MSLRFFRNIAFASAVAAATSFGAAAALADNECSKFGKPSYEADRTVSIGGQVTRSRVYVSGGTERAEIDHNGRTEIIILTPTEFISFDPVAKMGFRRRLAGGKPPAAQAGSIRVREEQAGANRRLILEGRSDSGEWTIINQVVCRSDGALLSKDSSVPINGAMVPTSMSQSIRPAGAMDRSLFVPPSDIRFQR